MSKIFKLFMFLILLAGLNVVNAQVFITELADPNNDAGARYIELYNAGASAVDFTEGSNWRIDKYTNASATVSQTLNLTGTIPAGGFYIIATGPVDGDFLTVYGVNADQFDGAVDNVAGSNGDDNLELYDGTGTLVDQFGVPGVDGTGTNHEFEDGRAERVATVTSGKALWDIAEWNIWNDGPSAIEGTTLATQDSPGSFDPKAWIGTSSSPLFEITDVVITNLNATQTKIEWKTTQPTSGFIFYAKEDTTNGFHLEAMESAGMVTEHNLTLDTLTTGLTYYFIIDQNDAAFNNVRSGTYSFIAGDVDTLPVSPYYLAGDFQGWNPSTTPLYDDGTNGDLVSGDGIYSLEFSVATSGFHGWKVTNGTWDVTWPASDSWFSSTTDPQTVLFTFNTNSVGDGWFPDQYIVNTNEAKPTTLVAVGDFQSEEGESGDWINNSTITAMHDDGLDGDLLSGDGIFCYHMKSLPIGSYSAKGVKAGEWNGWGTDGRSQDAKNINFTTTIENQDVYLYVNVNTGRTFLSFEAIEPFVAPKVFFSEYIEGGGNNKVLEIYNGSGSEINLSDFVIRINANGGVWSSVFAFGANEKLADGEVYVIAHAEAVSEITSLADTLIVNPYSGGTSYVTVFNGDDVRALCYVNGTDTTTIDIIGAYDGVDPGTGWSVAGTANATIDHSLVRKETVTSGNTDWTISAGTTVEDSEWEVYDKDTFKYLGQHPGEEVVVVTDPLVAAPTPLVDSSNVISLFSNAYNNVVVDTWSTSWDVADVADFVVEGNDTKLYTNIVYAGIETTSKVINASEMTHFHMDIWTPDSTVEPNVFKIKLVDFGANGVWSGGDDVEHEVTLSASTTPALATGEWVSIDLPLSDFTALTTKEHMAQYIISGNLKTVYVDNMYFYKAANAILYSNFETGLGDWTPRSVTSTKDWLQATGTGALGTTAFAQANGYGEEAPSNDYLIAGPFNLNNFTEEYMDFWSAAKYGKVDTELTLEYSTNYDGSADPSAFTWTALNFTLPVDLNDTWTYSGKIDLSTINSDVVYIAFHYLSNGTDIGRKKIDEVGIYGTPEQGVDLPPVVESVNRTVVIPNANQDTEVTAIVSDDKGVSSVNLVYSNDGTIFSSVAMTNTTGNTWVGNVPEALYNDGDLFGYLVAAADNGAQTDTSDITMLFAGNTRIENIKMLTDDGVLEFKNVMAKVTGTVSAGSGTYSTGRIEAYMQDDTAGVLVIAFGTETPAMVEGNSYTVTGKIIQYNGLVEIEPVTPASDIVDNGSVAAVVPLTTTISEINGYPEQFEGRLVKIEFAELSSTTAWLAGSSSGSTMKIFVGTDTLDLRVDADTDIWGTDAPTFPQDIIGVLGQFDSSIPYNSGYQLMPRRLADFDASVGVDDQNGIPTVYDLSQNYPNPFNPSTKIKFSLPESGLVSLKIYDILGREVATLINEELPASYQTVDFNASNLSTGIYFYRINVNNYTSVKKMILMK